MAEENCPGFSPPFSTDPLPLNRPYTLTLDLATTDHGLLDKSSIRLGGRWATDLSTENWLQWNGWFKETNKGSKVPTRRGGDEEEAPCFDMPFRGMVLRINT